MNLPSRRWSLALAGAVQFVCAVAVGGRLQADEIHQFLEPAHRAVWGYGSRSHEWYSGMRNVVGPGAIASVFMVCRGIGIDDPRAILAAVHFAVGGFSLFAIARWAEAVRRASGSEHTARLALLTLALWVPWEVAAYRTLAETISTAALLVSFELFTRSPRRALAAGLWAGAAFVLRYPSGLFLPAFAFELVRSRDREATARWTLGVAVAIAALAALDAWAWGTPLHSLAAYFDFNVVHGRGSDFGVSPAWYYLGCLVALCPVGMITLGFACRGSLPRSALPLAVAGIYLAGMSLVGHKEPRFFLPVIPFVIAGAALWPSEWSKQRAAMGLVLTALHSAGALAFLRATDVAQRESLDAVVEIGRRTDVAALWMMNRMHPGWVHLRRAVPIVADYAGRLGPTVTRLDAELRRETSRGNSNRGVTYALCDRRGDEGLRCEAAIGERGFRKEWARGAVTVWSRPGRLGVFNGRR